MDFIADPAAVRQEEERIKEELVKITVRAWTDPQFCEQLQTNPREALTSLGIAWPEHIDPHFLVDSERNRHVVIPLNPTQYFAQDIEYHLERLARLHVEITCTVSWTGGSHRVD